MSITEVVEPDEAQAPAPADKQAIPPAPPVFRWSFSGAGLAVGALFFAFSLFPSLLPRPGYVQGIVSGITVMIGYGMGALGATLWRALRVPSPKGTARRIVLGGLLGIVAFACASAIWQHIGWQNDVRAIFSMPSVSPLNWPVILVVTVAVSALILIVARSLWRLFAAVGRALGRHLPARLSMFLAGVGIAVVLWLLITGVLVRLFFGVANVMFSLKDSATTDGVVATTSELRSGGQDSLVSWDSLGRKGRDFVATGPTVAQINEVTGGGAVEPIRVYAGLKSAGSLQERADLVLAELKRTGAFDRDVLVVATTTGTGFLDPAAVDPLEYLHNGDTAIAGVQYSYLPSWISLLADQEAVKKTSRTVFETVHDYWATLPEDQRPKLYLYGLSLGSFGVESILNSINVINEPVDGAFMSGPPFVNPMHAEIVAGRDPGSPASMPVYSNGRTVRFTGEDNQLDDLQGAWGPTRLVYLQHASDPVVFFHQNLALQAPEWLEPGQRGSDISDEFVWVPLVTMWQVGLDLPAAGSVPWGYAHLYSPRANLNSWIAVTQPKDWNQAKTEAVVTAMAPVIAK